ncbi:MAG TPA: hypothetical protein VFA07_16870 [Chthonomonadaceae bacterium]|nr:hypothetical protein [Chthonomonadaceae bacterium]
MAYSLITMMLFLSLPFAAIAIGLVLIPFFFHPKGLSEWIPLAVLFAYTGGALWFLLSIARHEHREAKRLPYVPPVTADTLPQEEVLLRGSQQPAQEQGKLLLRGAADCQENARQELLRAGRPTE